MGAPDAAAAGRLPRRESVPLHFNVRHDHSNLVLAHAFHESSAQLVPSHGPRKYGKASAALKVSPKGAGRHM